MNTKTNFIFTTVTVKFICNKTGRLHGVAETVEGSLVYLPKRLASQLNVGDIVKGKLKPSTDSRSEWCLVEIVDENRTGHRTPGLIVYDKGRFNIAPRGGS